MDIKFSPEDIAFRDEVRSFFAESYDHDLRTRMDVKETYKSSVVDWQKRLNAKGWIAPSWPVEHGGTGWSSTQKFIFETERAAAGVPDVIPFGLTMVAPVIIGFGSEEQKKRFLPSILNSDHWWCQGYSEPGAGSDLASLKTKAELDGDHYVVNGAKIWTTYAQYADWIFCLVRTNSDAKKQQGITFLLIDMKSEGIKVNPIYTIDNNHSLNEVEFNNVRVPVENRIGEENQGWTYAKALLAHERTGIACVADSQRRAMYMRDLASREVNAGRSLLDDPIFQKRLSDIEIELMALEYTELRVLAAAADGRTPGVESSLLKIKGTEMQQAIQELCMDIAAHYQGVLDGLDEWTLGHGFGSAARSSYMYGRSVTILGGSNEIQKNIIAKAVLGL